MLINVRSVEGRVARTAPDGGFIPHDKDMLVEKTDYITRLLDVHKDIYLVNEEKPKPETVVTRVSTDKK